MHKVQYLGGSSSKFVRTSQVCSNAIAICREHLVRPSVLYGTVISKKKSVGDELKWGIFESCDISLENTPTSHAVSPALFMYSDSTMLILSCAWLYNNSKWCLPSIVSPSSCTLLLLWCFLLHNRMCTAA